MTKKGRQQGEKAVPALARLSARRQKPRSGAARFFRITQPEGGD